MKTLFMASAAPLHTTASAPADTGFRVLMLSGCLFVARTVSYGCWHDPARVAFPITPKARQLLSCLGACSVWRRTRQDFLRTYINRQLFSAAARCISVAGRLLGNWCRAALVGRASSATRASRCSRMKPAYQSRGVHINRPYRRVTSVRTTSWSRSRFLPIRPAKPSRPARPIHP